MKVRNTRARLCAVLFTSFFTSISFAQVSAVTDMASFAGDDFIDWQSQSGDVDPNRNPDLTSISTDGGMAVTVALSSPFNEADPSSYVGTNYFATNMPVDDFEYYLYPYYLFDFYNYVNPINFTDFDGEGICGLGTQIAPYEAGEYLAWIKAFDASGTSMGVFDVIADTTTESESAFIGIESTDPMHRVEVSIQGTGGDGSGNYYGSYAAFFAINRVDLKACADDPPEPEAPVVSCEGFGAPMDKFPVKTKKNRVLPLKMELFDADGFALTDDDLAAGPVVDVMFTSSTGGDPIDVTSEVTSVGKASTGNQFVFADDIWQFKLSSKPYTAPGTYVVSVVSGDDLEYVIDPSCVTEFVKK